MGALRRDAGRLEVREPRLAREDGWLIRDAILQSVHREMESDKGTFAELGMLKK